ncbi:hypothetical protein ACHWQZ_G015513 [Mnemiopsis leidyi]
MGFFTSALLLLLSASTTTALSCYSCVKETEENGDIVQITDTCLDKSAATVCFPGQVCVQGNYESPFRKGRTRITEYFKGCDEPCTDAETGEVCNEKWCDTDFCNDMLPEEIRTYVRGQEEGTEMGIEEATEGGESEVENGGEEEGGSNTGSGDVVDEETGKQAGEGGSEDDDTEEVVENMDGGEDTDEGEGTEETKEDGTSTINTTSEGELDVEETVEDGNGETDKTSENKDGEEVDGGEIENKNGDEKDQVVDEQYVVDHDKKDTSPENSTVSARLSDFLGLVVVLMVCKLSF